MGESKSTLYLWLIPTVVTVVISTLLMLVSRWIDAWAVTTTISPWFRDWIFVTDPERARQTILQVLQTLIKQRKDSVEQFRGGGRHDLADKETREIAIIEGYLPAGASEEEMDQAIAAAIAETGANSPKQMGAGMKAAKAKLEGKTVDGKALSDRVRERLQKLAG